MDRLLWNNIRGVKCKTINRPLYSCVLSYQAFKWKRGWCWYLLWYRPPSFSCVNDIVVMLISKNLNKKDSEVSIKTRSTSASLSFIGQVTKHTIVKWTIGHFYQEGWWHWPTYQPPDRKSSSVNALFFSGVMSSRLSYYFIKFWQWKRV